MAGPGLRCMQRVRRRDMHHAMQNLHPTPDPGSYNAITSR
jgi:hypothetical protein